jgi:hypothetical protein
VSRRREYCQLASYIAAIVTGPVTFLAALLGVTKDAYHNGDTTPLQSPQAEHHNELAD